MRLLDLLTEDDTAQVFADNPKGEGGLDWEIAAARKRIETLSAIVTSAEDALRYNREDLTRERQRLAFLEGKGAP